MNKAQAAAVTLSQILIAPWFSFWMSLTLSQSPFLAYFASLFSIPTAFYVSIQMINRGKGYDLLSRNIYQFRQMFSFSQYTDPVATIEYATLWTVCLILGSSLTYNYLYALIPYLTGLDINTWERWLVFMSTVIVGSVCVSVYALVLNWTLNDHTVKDDIEKKGYNNILAAHENERHVKQGAINGSLSTPGHLFRQAESRFLPSLLLTLLGVTIGVLSTPLLGSLVGLVAVHSLFNLPSPTKQLSLWHLYAVAEVLLTGSAAALMLAAKLQPLELLLVAASSLTLGVITVTCHPSRKTLMPLYSKLGKGVLWCIAALLWSLYSHNYPATISFLFSGANLSNLAFELVKKKKYA